ncbi:MAG: exo-alpha-sialidase [Gemmatimonadetes bacterium]|nr:exo-alpha-sialidase [Gemmatimonadota bacterium]MBT7863707.1 exo-alpha-sialidase [Gemmatimonadota bacterium]
MQITIGDGAQWAFSPCDWEDAETGQLQPVGEPGDHGEAGMQGYRFAFRQDESLTDFRAHFQIRHDKAHADVGLIFRAASNEDFYVFHLPCCGQAYRAQHFWGAVSRMDSSGYLRIQQLKMIARVNSLTNIWHDIEVEVQGDTLTATIDGRGHFEISGLDVRPGCIGLMQFNVASLRHLVIEGPSVAGHTFQDTGPQPVNWFQPCRSDEYGLWQKPQSLLRSPSGDLVLVFGVQERPYEGRTTMLASRSKDDGRTWDDPEVLQSAGDDPWGMKGRFHQFPDGRIRCLMAEEGGYTLYEVSDDLRELSSPHRLDLGPQPEGMPTLHMGPQAFLNQSDGSVQLFLYGAHDSSQPATSIHTWGSVHCQAFTTRSEDGGRTWSPVTSIDGVTNVEGDPIMGSLDLTEVCCAESAPGILVALIRPVYSPWMWETWSRDGGRSWEPCMRGSFPGYATPAMLKTASGAILVAHRLPGCTIHASFDGGLTWDDGTMIDSSIWVMGSMMEVKPDLVLYVSYDSFESRMRAQFIRVQDGKLHPVRREDLA